jgi:hypothetical protein
MCAMIVIFVDVKTLGTTPLIVITKWFFIMAVLLTVGNWYIKKERKFVY